MDAIGTLLLWLHLMAISVAGAAVFGIPVLGSALGRAAPEMRPVLMGLAKRLSMLGRGALVVLLVTGPLLIWAKYGGSAAFGTWFSVKMVVVLLLTANVIFSGFNAKWIGKGDKAALARAPMLAMASMVLLTLTVLFAVLTFA